MCIKEGLADPSLYAPEQGVPANLGGGGGDAGGGGGPLEFLRNHPQFQAMRQVVQANPQILQPMLQELGRQNPHLLQVSLDLS